MWPKVLARRLGIDYPILLAPMAGGPSTPDLVAAVSEAGGLGSLGAAYLAPDALREAIRDIRARTSRPFAVNLFVPERSPAVPGADAGSRGDGPGRTRFESSTVVSSTSPGMVR